MRENIAKNLCKVIALANQKGGVAKSFTTASLAVGLVNSGNGISCNGNKTIFWKKCKHFSKGS